MISTQKKWKTAKRILENSLEGKPFDKYLIPKEFESKKIEDLMERMLFHAQNNARKKNSIKFEKYKKEYKKALFNFTPIKVSKMTVSDIKEALHNNGINDSSNGNSERSLFNQYVKAIKSIADFLKEYETSTDFINHCKNTDKKELLLEVQKVDWFGKALSADFLKELGFDCYAKPDTHIKNFISEIFGCTPNDDEVMEKINEIASETGETQFAIDKLIYLACTHHFYMKGDEVYSDSKNSGNAERRNKLIKKIKDEIKSFAINNI